MKCVYNITKECSCVQTECWARLSKSGNGSECSPRQEIYYRYTWSSSADWATFKSNNISLTPVLMDSDHDELRPVWTNKWGVVLQWCTTALHAVATPCWVWPCDLHSRLLNCIHDPECKAILRTQGCVDAGSALTAFYHFSDSRRSLNRCPAFIPHLNLYKMPMFIT